MSKTNNNIPDLRFPEFKRESTDNLYKKHLFKDIFLFATGKNIKQSEASPEFKTPCIRYGELYYMYKEVIYEIINRTNLDKSELIFSKGNEILLPSAGEDPLDIGSASALTLKNIAIGRTINILSPKEDNIYSQKYVSYYINHKLRKKISTLARGSSISNVYNSDLKNLEIKLSSLTEQIKVANFLTTIDKRINILKEKEEALKDYKKGVMQKIFNQEIRFKNDNGKDFPEWEEKRLSDLGEIITGKTPKTSNKDLWDGDIDFITPTDINDSEKFQLNVARTIKRTDKLKVLPINSIVYTCIASIGKMAITTKPSVTNQQINSIIVKDEYVNEYLYYALLHITPKIKSTQANTTLPIINKTEFSKFKINVPNIIEQQKIASFLSSIDKSIEELGKQIKVSVDFKKGLLQKMFV